MRTIRGTDLFEQLEWHWQAQLRPRLEGLSDDEYLWEPVPGCWSVRSSGGAVELDRAWPQPEPPPVTTIAWRIAHVTGGVLGFRANWHFGDKTAGWETFTPAASAGGALRDLDAAYASWRDGVLSAPERFFAERSEGPPGTLDGRFPFAAVVLHINREVIHHGAEIALLRDLYAAGSGAIERPTLENRPTGPPQPPSVRDP